ncbi:MAG: peroxiredoxin [Blastocatellia bacterium]|nr:peroxiredoxin [Blastocatellia bacterium]
MLKTKLLYSIIAITLLSLSSVVVSAFSSMPEVGQTAPDFSLKSNESSNVSLKDFRGKWIVLYFYPKDFTSGCTVQARNFQRDLASYEKANAVILGVSVDSAETHKEFCAKENLNFKLLADTDAKISDTYGSVIEYNGNKYSARNTFIINPEGKIAKVFPNVKVAQHSEEVLATLAELQKK